MANEADTCRKFVVPKLQAAGWDIEPHSIAEQRTFTDRHIVPLKDERAKRRVPKRAEGAPQLGVPRRRGPTAGRTSVGGIRDQERVRIRIEDDAGWGVGRLVFPWQPRWCLQLNFLGSVGIVLKGYSFSTKVNLPPCCRPATLAKRVDLSAPPRHGFYFSQKFFDRFRIAKIATSRNPSLQRLPVIQFRPRRLAHEPGCLSVGLSSRELCDFGSYVSWQTIRQEFGNLIVEFQLLESVLKDAVSHLLNPHDYSIGLIVTAPMQFRQILGVLYALFHYKNLKTTLKKCVECATKKNDIVHSYWTPKKDGSGLKVRIKRSDQWKPFEIQNKTITPQDLEAETAFFKATRRELDEFFLKLFPEFNLRQPQSRQFPGMVQVRYDI